MIYKEIPIKTDGSMESAKLKVYIQDTPGDTLRYKIKKRPMIFICPGGGYYKVSYREGEPLAMHFLGKGYHACVLEYSVAPARFPVHLFEVEDALKVVWDHADDWKVDTSKIFLHGASAGGHLAASYGVFYNDSWMKYHIKPAGILLSYPVITSDVRYGHMDSFYNLLGERFEELKDKMSLEHQVNDTTPPTFIWHTLTDETVPVENSLLMLQALKNAGISAELHVFPEGEHGLSLANYLVGRDDGSGVSKTCSEWINLADTWIKNQTKKENNNE